MKRTLRAAATVATTLALGLSMAACGSGSDSDSAGGGKQVTLMLNFYPYGDHAPFYYGVKQGIFKKHGIDLKIEAGKGSTAVAQAVGSNKADFGIVDTPSVLTSVDAGVKIKSLGVLYQTSPSAVQFLKSSGITKPADLKGKTVAITPGDPYSATFPAFLKANGMSIKDVKTVNVQAAAKIAAVVSGKADALCGFISDQGPTIADKTGKATGYLLFADYGLPYLGTGLTVSDKTLADDPKLAKSMFEATSESYAAAVKDPAAAVKAMDGVSPTLPSQSVLTEQWKRASSVLSTPRTKSKPAGVNDEADWNDTIKLFQSLGVVKTVKPASTYWKPFEQ
jgi:NitT/TauT family transport system substrate-binding protein